MAAQIVRIGKRSEPVTLTPEAQAKVAELLRKEPDGQSLLLRIAVKPGGCSGYTYDMYFDSETEEDDIVTTFGEVRVVVDAQSARLLQGSVLDYSDDLRNSGFRITNPNVTRTCGCGNSFS
jgi:iron-sulfur cluster assembly accessory protein